MPAVCLELFHAALLPRVLVPADHHRPLVLPQVEDALPHPHRFEQAGFPRKVSVRQGISGFIQINPLYHPFPCFLLF